MWKIIFWLNRTSSKRWVVFAHSYCAFHFYFGVLLMVFNGWNEDGNIRMETQFHDKWPYFNDLSNIFMRQERIYALKYAKLSLIYSVLIDCIRGWIYKEKWKSTRINRIMVPIMEILISLVAQGNVFSLLKIYFVTVVASNPINILYIEE